SRPASLGSERAARACRPIAAVLPFGRIVGPCVTIHRFGCVDAMPEPEAHGRPRLVRVHERCNPVPRVGLCGATGCGKVQDAFLPLAPNELNRVIVIVPLAHDESRLTLALVTAHHFLNADFPASAPKLELRHAENALPLIPAIRGCVNGEDNDRFPE